MPTIKRFEDLECWQEARSFVRLIYKMADKNKFKKDFELVGQIKRSAISSMANITEGFHRNSTKEFMRFLDYSRASVAETLSHCYIAMDQEYINEDEMNEVKQQADVVWKKVNNFISYLRKVSKTNPINKTNKTTRQPRAMSPFRTSCLILTLIAILLFPSLASAAAKWSLTPRVYSEGYYDDNIFLTERNEQTDFVTVVSPGINLQYLSPTAEINLDYEYQRFWYNDFPDLDYHGHRANVLARKDFWPWFGAEIREVFIRSEDPIELTGITEFERPSVRTGRRNRYSRNIVEPEATFRFGERRSIRVGYRNHILRNKEEDIADITENAANALLNFRFNIHNGIDVFYEHVNYEYGEPFPPEPDRDFDGNEARGRYTYYFDPKTSAFVDYRFYHRNFERETLFFPDYVVHDPRLGFSRDLYENVSLTASAGYAVRDADGKKKEGTFSGRGDLSARHKRLTVSLYSDAGFGEDFLSAETFGPYEFWRAGFNGRFDILERLWAEGYFYIERDRYVDIARADRYLNVRALLGYQLLKWFFFSVEYVYNNRDSSVDFESYRDNRYFGRLTVQYDIAEHFQ